MRSRTTEEAARTTAPVKELAAGIAAVDRDLKIAETTVGLFSQAAFPMKQGESPVLAIEGKLMEGEKCHGTLYFTNQRFLFEGQKEVVLEKKLFIVTKKRIDRSVMFEQPVGAVQDITKGRVGLLAGAGVYVTFRSEVGLPVTPFDVRGWEADVITRFYKYITGGEAERDIAGAHGGAPPSAPTIRLVRCPACGAPHSGEIYQGQTSVKCEYCGSAVAVA
jgi:DNA-directed RNA polymerase subunit RPC12/RpoP